MVEQGYEFGFIVGGSNYDLDSRLEGTLTITNFNAPLDDDGDGVLNPDDLCPDTPAGEVTDATGCSIGQLCPCEDNWRNHGGYVSCTAQEAERFANDGLISWDEKDAIVSAAARSECGRK